MGSDEEACESEFMRWFMCRAGVKAEGGNRYAFSARANRNHVYASQTRLVWGMAS
jgi:hypothetical protein